MSRIYQEYQESLNANPLAHLYKIVCQEITHDLGCSGLLDGVMSAYQYAYYLLFEAVAQKLKDEAVSDATSIHSYLSSLPEDDSFLGGDITNAAKVVSYDFALRKEFHFSELTRLGIPFDVEIAKEYQKMGDRSFLHDGYKLTRFQLEQLHDKEDFTIKKVNEFRQFRSSKHTKNEDVIAFYDVIIEHVKKCKAETDVKMRVIQAINLYDFENKNIPMFLYHTAKYCAYNGIKVKDLDETRLYLLLCVCGVIRIGNSMVYHKPVVAMRDYIAPALEKNTIEIDRYLQLEYYGLYFRKEILPSLLDKISYTYEEINQFFFSPAPFTSYDVFGPYLSGVEWSNASKLIPVLRKLIAELTIDPLSK